jgi:hypothetical protein
MKSEERHKLQQNELADYLAKIVEQIKPYQNAILGGIILVLVIILLVNWWNGKSAAEMDIANTQLHNATIAAMNSGEPSELIVMADKYYDSPAATIAALTAADIYLNNGCNLLFSNKAKAKSELGYAVELYKKKLPNLRNRFLIAQANFGLARAEECQSDLTNAKKHYEEVVKIAPDGPYGVLASRRLEDIGRPSTKANYDKFAQYEPKTFKDDMGLSDKAPFDLDKLPQEPLITPDSFSKKLNLNNDKKIDFKNDELMKDLLPPPGDQPIKDEKKTDETKPADGEKPATTPPSDPPATETPTPAENGK